MRARDSLERPPRLVLRFALLTTAVLALAGAAILVVVRQASTAQAQRAAANQADFAARAVLTDAVRSGDLRRPVTGARRAQLDRTVASALLVDGNRLVIIGRPNAGITYASDHRLIGSPDPAPAAKALRSRATTTTVGSLGSRKMLETYVPIHIGDTSAVVGIYQDYAPIESAARASYMPVAGVLEGVLILLFVLLVPALARVTRRIQRQIRVIGHQAYFDELTGLPNRVLFRREIDTSLERAAADGGAVSVLLLDLNRFKDVNDTLGHGCGDEVLQAVALRLGELEGDVVLARLGGDEFGILVRGGSHAAADAGERASAALKEPIEVAGIPIALGASIGAATYPRDGEDSEALLRGADVALYAAKDGRLGMALYDRPSDPNDPARLALGAELGRALAGDELVLFHQPKIEIATGRVVGVEALVRWRHPVRGLLGPDTFVPFAERTGLIRPLSRHVLRQALAQCRTWREIGLDLRVAVNVTMHDLVDAELPDEISTFLDDEGLDATALELEITESSLMADPFRVRNVLSRIADLGVRIAIDDFGTGYSSLAYLKRLPVDELKIDRSFVKTMTTDASDETIVRSTVDLARNLGLTVVAEGVESSEALEKLRELGCDLAQGYYTGRPMPAEDLTPMLLRADESPRPAPRRRRAAAGVASTS